MYWRIGGVFLSNWMQFADRNRVPVASVDVFGMVRWQDDDDASDTATATRYTALHCTLLH